MNRLSSPRPILRPCRQAAALLLLAALPGHALAQKPAAQKPAVPPPAAAPAVPSSDAGPSLALSPKEALAQKRMLDADKRLDCPVTLDVISVPLDEVLQKESTQAKPSVNKSADAKPSTDAKASADAKPDPDKLVLTASHNCESLKLQIRLNRRPLRTLMTALAEMLPGTWTRTKEGYNLSLTDKAVITRSEWWRLFLGEREKALAAQRQAVLAAMQTKARRRQADDPEPEPSNHAIEEEIANQHDFFVALPPALKEQIAADMEETAFYEVGHVGYGSGGEQFGAVGWLSQMSPETQEKFKAALQDNITNHLAPLPPAFQKYAQQAQQGLAALDPSKVYFLFRNYGVGVTATPFNGPPSLNTSLQLNLPQLLSLPVLMLDQSRLADFVYGGGMTGPHWKQLANRFLAKGDAALDIQKELIYEVYGMGQAAPPEWRQLADYQRGRVWPNTLPKLPRDDGRPQPIVISRAAQTDWLGEQGHMEYVSDYYCDYHCDSLSRSGYEMPPEQRKLPLRRPLATELDEMAAKRDVSWERDADGIVLVRNNRWYRDDSLEVPQPLLRRWFARLLQARRQEAAAQAAVPVVPQTPEERMAAMKQDCDWAAEVSGALTPWQIRNGLALFQPEEKDLAPQNDATEAKLFEKLKHRVPQPGGAMLPPGFDEFTLTTRMPPFSMTVLTLKGYPHTINLYGSLDDMGRAALLAGRLPVSALTPAQLAEAASLLPLLPQAMQTFPADSVLLSLPPAGGATDRILLGAMLPTAGLKLVTPQGNPPPPSGP